MLNDNANKVIIELLETLLSRSQISFETSLRGVDFIFESVQLLHRKCYKIKFKRGVHLLVLQAGYKIKKATINLKNTDDKCFQCVVNLALNYGEIKWNPEKVSNVKPNIKKYNWKGMKYLTKIKILLLTFYVLKQKKCVQLIFYKLEL